VDAWKAAIVQRDSGSSRLTIAEWVASLNRAWLVGSCGYHRLQVFFDWRLVSRCVKVWGEKHRLVH
jgi:hypothetical protein